MASVSLKLLVDKEENRVVFAECEKDFVDILLSFLTLPLGTIVRLLGKKSSLGCMDKLYESVENLDTKYLETEACKTMLLQPRSAAERLCEDLIVSADDLEPRRVYRCPSFVCFPKTNRLYSTIPGGARCPCGKAMDHEFQWDPTVNDSKDGVFLKGEATYTVGDDLHVAPTTVTNTLFLLQKMGIEDAKNLEMHTVEVHRDKVLGLLKRLLVSKTPLTDVFLRGLDSLNKDKEEIELIEPAQIKLESGIEARDQARAINVKILHNKITQEVVYAEAGHDFVDALLSFLTVPLGSVVKLLNKHSSLGCADNLYCSVEVLDAESDFIKSQECKNMLLSPKLYSHFDCSNQIIQIETNLSTQCRAHGCETCSNTRIHTPELTKCTHGVNVVRLTEINPKLPTPSKEKGGGFVKQSVRCIISNEMDFKALSPLSAIDVIKRLEAPISSLMEKEVTLGEAEVLNLLKACLNSSNALSCFFTPKMARKLS